MPSQYACRSFGLQVGLAQHFREHVRHSLDDLNLRNGHACCSLPVHPAGDGPGPGDGPGAGGAGGVVPFQSTGRKNPVAEMASQTSGK